MMAACTAQEIREHQDKIRNAVRECLINLEGNCAACFTIDGVFVKSHLLGVDCRKVVGKERKYVDIGFGWIGFKKSIQPDSEILKVCFGCHMPMKTGHEIIVHTGDVVPGTKCKFVDIVAQVAWCVFKIPTLYKDMIKDFALNNQIAFSDYAAWCSTTHDIFYTNCIRIFYWICQKRRIISLPLFAEDL